MPMKRSAIAGVAMALSNAPAAAAEVQALQARGVQIYVCQAAQGRAVWHFKAPDAILIGPGGATIGRHFAGPSWQANDGSLVLGAVIASNGAGVGAVPWLLLRAVSHQGAGRFAHVSYIVRTDTRGGAPPVGGCDTAHDRLAVRVAYRATYVFFSE